MARVRVVKEGTVVTPQQQQLIDEALHAFPDLAHDATEELFPRKNGVRRCRLCGQQRSLTREHVPPRTAYNTEAGRMHTLLEWLGRTAEDALPGGFVHQGGNWGYTLCAECNHFTGHQYASEYGRMAGGIVNTFVGVNVNDLDAQLEQPIAQFGLTGAAAGLAPRPGAFISEVLALMCTMSADFDLAGKFPAIRRIVLDGALEALPQGMSLGMTAYFHKDSRFAGPLVQVSLSDGTWKLVMEIAHRPLAVLMVIAGTAPNPHVCDISALTLIAPELHQEIEGRIAIGFGHTALPGDYRTHAMIEAGAAPAT
jgi:hypothetical protein